MKVAIDKAAKELGVAKSTLRRWEDEGRIKTDRTKGGHRRFDLDELRAFIATKDIDNDKRIAIGYARVSTRKKIDDLQRQSELLELFCASHGWQYRIIEDVGSGLNYNKKGLSDLIRLIEANQVSHLVLNYKDRLLRFGSEIIFDICKLHGTEVIIMNEGEKKTHEEELVEDVLSIITVFSAKLYGSRSHKNKKVVDAAKELFKDD